MSWRWLKDTSERIWHLLGVGASLAIALIGTIGPFPLLAQGAQTRPKGDQSIVIVLKTCKDADCARQAIDEYRDDPLVNVTLPEGYPRVLTSADAPELGPGVLLVALGLCKTDPRFTASEKEHYPEVTTKRVGMTASVGDCVTRKKRVQGGSVALKEHSNFMVTCRGGDCSIVTKRKEGTLQIFNAGEMAVDRMSVISVGPLFKISAGCGTACSTARFVDPVNGEPSESFGNVYCSDANLRLLARGSHDVLVVQPIFGWTPSEKRLSIKRPWGLDAEQSILDCNFLPKNRLRIFYSGRNGAPTREIIDIPAFK